jgi:hypothetical protein
VFVVGMIVSEFTRPRQGYSGSAAGPNTNNG